MNPENLFKQPAKREKEKSTSETKSIAITSSLEDKLISFSLVKNKRFKVITGSQKQICNWVKQGSVDYALLSAADLAIIKGGWRIIPHFCKTDDASAKKNLLFFKKNLKEFKKIAVLNGDRTAFLILKILLKEVYQLEPVYIEKTEVMSKNLFEEFDGVLVSGADAVVEAKTNSSFIDISEEWLQLTGLPVVNGFWVANDISMDKEDIPLIMDSYKEGLTHIKKICTEHNEQNAESLEIFLTNSIKNNFTQQYQDSLSEMYTYAFFYGLTEYVPDLNFVDL